MKTPMQYSKAGEDLTKQFESCRLVAYADSKGVPTIGWGHTEGVHLGMHCTQDQADKWLLQDIQVAVFAVNRLVTVDLTQEEFDALVDFTFNVGQGNFSSSTLLKDLISGNFSAASNEFERWDKCGGKVLAGLLRRRVAEKAEFLGETK